MDRKWKILSTKSWIIVGLVGIVTFALVRGLVHQFKKFIPFPLAFIIFLVFLFILTLTYFIFGLLGLLRGEARRISSKFNYDYFIGNNKIGFRPKELKGIIGFLTSIKNIGVGVVLFCIISLILFTLINLSM